MFLILEEKYNFNSLNAHWVLTKTLLSRGDRDDQNPRYRWKEKIIIIIQCNKYPNTDMNKMTFTHSFQKHAMNSTGSPPPPHVSKFTCWRPNSYTMVYGNEASWEIIRIRWCHKDETSALIGTDIRFCSPSAKDTARGTSPETNCIHIQPPGPMRKGISVTLL